MKTLARWWRFNLVGAGGAVLQLTVLALLQRAIPGHYLVATAAALELTLLHNFVWHLHYTWPGTRPDNWRDRAARHSWLVRLLRFHLSNGIVSLLGNLLIMRLLVQGAHLPPLIANAVAILGCSVLNFLLGNAWSFAPAAPVTPR